jgi:hypothetical protein
MKKLVFILMLAGIVACLYAEKQYDYLFFVIGENGGFSNRTQNLINDKEPVIQAFFERNSINPKKFSFNELLAAAGKDGWLLITQNGTGTTGYAMTFVKEKEQQ